MKIITAILFVIFISCNQKAETKTETTDTITKDGTTATATVPIDTTADMLTHSGAVDNPAWQLKKDKGVAWLGIGTEPFWSVEKRKDSLAFQLSDWSKAIVLKSERTINTKDSVVYIASNDSTKLETRIFPGKCSDGMSDRVYDRNIRVLYNGQEFKGCAVIF
jgi:uncharacterized membrane protein